jgi:hypothetical protein
MDRLHNLSLFFKNSARSNFGTYTQKTLN